MAAAAVFASTEPMSRWLRLTLALSGVAACGLLAANLATGVLDVRHAKGLPEAGRVIFSKWNSFSRVTVWGSLADPSVLVMIDADAGTLVVRDSGDWSAHPWLGDRLESLVYRLRPAERALVIGAGGGLDVASARLLSAREVTAVEVNPAIARDVMSSEPFLATPAASTSGPACAWWWTKRGASSGAGIASTTSSRPPWSTPGPPLRPGLAQTGQSTGNEWAVPIPTSRCRFTIPRRLNDDRE